MKTINNICRIKQIIDPDNFLNIYNLINNIYIEFKNNILNNPINIIFKKKIKLFNFIYLEFLYKKTNKINFDNILKYTKITFYTKYNNKIERNQ